MAHRMTHHSSRHRRTKLLSILPSYHPPPELLVHQVHQENKPQLSTSPEINLDFTHIPATKYDTPKSSMAIRKIIRMNRYAKDAIQGDTGANCSATNNISLLWDYWPLTKPTPIVTYQGQDKRTVNNFEAVGTGIIKMIVDDTTVNSLTLYTPNSTGTIISSDRYMMDNGHIHEFLLSGSHNGKGHLQFINSGGKTVAKVKMKRQCKGLWYTDIPVLVPPPTLANTSSVTDADLESNPITQTQYIGHFPSDKATLPNINRNGANKHNNLSTNHHVDGTSITGTQTTGTLASANGPSSTSHLTKISSSGRWSTQNTLQLQSLPLSILQHCQTCQEIRQPHIRAQNFIPGTAFHMDLGFICGPKMVKDNIGISRPSKTQTAQQLHDGYLAYLIIVDAATRYVFCFPLKSRSPPLALIDKIINKNGHPQQQVISTSPNGLHHKSKSFAEVCKKYGYSKNAHQILDEPYEELLSMGLKRPQYYIHTDNGNELAGSQDFCQLASDHEFIVETTAPDSSISENGLGERPHRTLKEKVCCLLYTARLGVKFWSDTLLHAVWLYNCTYHTSIDWTPYKAWTGQKPCLDWLLTFGAKVTARKAKNWNTALDQNHFLGIFLGFRATMNHLVYWDNHAQFQRTAKYLTTDELQYGDPPQERSLASKFLLEVVTGTLQEERHTDKLLNTIPKTCHNTPNESLDVNNLQTHIILDNPLPHKATAAKAKFNWPTTDELHRQLQQLDITLNIFEPAVS
jgi:hypothetical protein